jgi:hypothetical protein
VRKIILLVFSFVVSSGAAFSGDRRIAFARGTTAVTSCVWVAKLDGTAEKRIAKGSWLDISPDGTRLAFNTDEQSKRQKGRPLPRLIRHIAVADIASGKVTTFKDIPSDNVLVPSSGRRTDQNSASKSQLTTNGTLVGSTPTVPIFIW